jgi:hypothetical protein
MRFLSLLMPAQVAFDRLDENLGRDTVRDTRGTYGWITSFLRM